MVRLSFRLLPCFFKKNKMKVITGNRVLIKMWAEKVEMSAMEQIINLASLPFAFEHVAIMPDAHTGIGMPIGGVLATKGVIVPNAVGVDIGCGMCAIKTNIKDFDLSTETLKKIVSKIRNVIPLGFGQHEQPQDESYLPQDYDFDKMPMLKNLKKAIPLQVGTLGGGNHFIEIQHSTDGSVWVMLHSGSRNVGLKVANHYGNMAKRLNAQWYSETLPGLEFLPIEDQSAKNYFLEMRYCVDFALANRKLMMERICGVFEKYVKKVEFEPMINIAHNYAAWERHFGSNVIVHRKGATRAYKGEIGIIPGSQGTHSYIVEGLGNPESFKSCSHGAGRIMGRKEAIRQLDFEQEVEILEKQGIIHSLCDKNGLDEASGAYKDIDTVMSNQIDLVRPIVKLRPLAVIKG